MFSFLGAQKTQDTFPFLGTAKSANTFLFFRGSEKSEMFLFRVAEIAGYQLLKCSEMLRFNFKYKVL